MAQFKKKKRERENVKITIFVLGLRTCQGCGVNGALAVLG